MSKLKEFISNHRKKIAFATVISGIAALTFVKHMPEQITGYANENVSIIHEINQDHDDGVDDVLIDIQEEDTNKQKGFNMFNVQIQDDRKEFILDVVFIAKEYDRDKPIEKRIPVQGVDYKVYNQDSLKLVAQGKTDKNGQFVAKNLPEGNYTWVQASVPSKYQPMTTDGTANGPLNYAYFSIHHTDEEMVIYGGLEIKESKDDPIKDSEGNIVDEDGNRLDENGNIIPEEEDTLPIEPPIEDVDKPIEDESDIDKPVEDESDVDDIPVKDDGNVDKPIEDETDIEEKENVIPSKDSSNDSVDKDKEVTSNKVDNKELISSKKDNTEDKVKDEKINPEDVQTYDKGVLGFIGLALISFIGFIVLNQRKKKV